MHSAAKHSRMIRHTTATLVQPWLAAEHPSMHPALEWTSLRLALGAAVLQLPAPQSRCNPPGSSWQQPPSAHCRLFVDMPSRPARSLRQPYAICLPTRYHPRWRQTAPGGCWGRVRLHPWHPRHLNPAERHQIPAHESRFLGPCSLGLCKGCPALCTRASPRIPSVWQATGQPAQHFVVGGHSRAPAKVLECKTASLVLHASCPALSSSCPGLAALLPMGSQEDHKQQG
jgi:hypothetical protein